VKAKGKSEKYPPFGCLSRPLSRGKPNTAILIKKEGIICDDAPIFVKISGYHFNKILSDPAI